MFIIYRSSYSLGTLYGNAGFISPAVVPLLEIGSFGRSAATSPDLCPASTWRFMGFRVVISGVLSRVTIVITQIRGLITPLYNYP